MSLVWILLGASLGQALATQPQSQKSSNTIMEYNYSRSSDFSLFGTDNIQRELSWLILDLSLNMDPGHCYAIIFDAVYETVFSVDIFERIKQTARFIVKIPQDEDTLNPQPTLKCALRDIRKAGCGGYIILLANGIQMGRLLRFGDKTRLIDTRARFIMLHDYRLFRPQLHYIWRRIINVIFARRIRKTVQQKSRTSLGSSGPPTYELSTVPFPIPIKGVFFSKILNFWQSGKFLLPNNDFYGDKISDLGGQKMQVVILEHTPGVFKNEIAFKMGLNNPSENGNLASSLHYLPFSYYGIEVKLLTAISMAMHFQFMIYETPDAVPERWGTMYENGTITGLLRDMHEGRADFALADLHLTEYNLGFMDLSIPYTTYCLTFLTPEALRDNSWKTLIMPFSGAMWAGILLSFVFVGFVFYAFSTLLTYIHRHEKSYQPEYDLILKPKFNMYQRSKLSIWNKTFQNWKLSKRLMRRVNEQTKSTSLHLMQTKLRKLRMVPFKRKPEPWHDPLPTTDIFDTISGCIIYTYSMTLLVSLPRLPNGWPLRVLTGWYWVYCVLVAVAYRASFTAILANPIPRLTIDTLEDLAESPIRCGAWGDQSRLFFQKAQDSHSQTIGTKLEHVANQDLAVEQVVNGMYAYYENIYLLRQLRSIQKSEKARQTLHIMKECIVNMPISIGLEKNSPIKPKVDRHVQALVEGGLTGKWLSDVIERYQSNVEIPPPEATIDLTKMYAGIIALCCGYGFSLIAFFIEKLYWAQFVESSPTFDKYLLGNNYRKRN